MSVPPIRIVPAIFTPSIRSFMRFKQRSSVDLPQPEGPMYAVTRCLGTDIETSLSASLAPYHSERCSISTMGASMIDDALAWGFRLAATCTAGTMTSLLLDRRGRVPATQAVAHADGEQVEQHNDGQQQQGRGEDHRTGRVDVGRLEAHVVDVKAQVHELPVEMDERPRPVDR